MKFRKVLSWAFCLAILLSVVSTQIVNAGWFWEDPIEQTWYLQPTDHTVNTVLGYDLTTEEGDANRTMTATTSRPSDAPQTAFNHTSSQAIRVANQRKTFYTLNRYWLFYQNNTSPYSIRFTTSTDGITWETPTYISQGSSDQNFDVYLDEENHIVQYVNSFGGSLKYRKGTLSSDGTIAWTSEQTINEPTWDQDFWYAKTSFTGTSNVYDASTSYGAANQTTEDVIGTSAVGSLFYIDPFLNTTTSLGTSEPSSILMKGWRTPSISKDYPYGGWTPQVKLKNRAALAFKGRVGVRLWKAVSPDLSDAVMMLIGQSSPNGWKWLSEMTFSGAIGQEVIVNQEVYVGNHTLTAQYVYYEFLFNVTQSATGSTAGFYAVTNDGSVRVRMGAMKQWTANSHFSISVDSNDYPYISATNTNGFNNTVWAMKSSVNDGSWVTAWVAEIHEQDDSTDNYNTELLYLSNGNTLIVYQTGYEKIYSRYYNGSAWESAQIVSNVTNDYPFDKSHWNAVTNGTVVELVYNNMTTVPNRLLRYSYWTEATGWSTPIGVGGDFQGDKSVSITKGSNGTLYVFWANTTALFLKRRQPSGQWDTSPQVIKTDSNIANTVTLQSSYHDKYNIITLAYVTGVSSPYSIRYTHIGIEGNYVTASFGWRIWLLHSSGSTQELTSGSPTAIMVRNTMSEGFQSSTFNIPLTTLSNGMDAVLIIIYTKLGSDYFSLWKEGAVLVSSQLDYSKLSAATWAFNLYTKRTGSLVSQHYYTNAVFIFGSINCNSNIDNVSLIGLSPWERQMKLLNEGNFVQFIVLPWVYIIGNLFYGLLFAFFSITTYLRYNDARPVLIWFWIFGGSGGVATLLIPEIGLHLSWLLLAFALAGTLWQLIR